MHSLGRVLHFEETHTGRVPVMSGPPMPVMLMTAAPPPHCKAKGFLNQAPITAPS